MLEVVHEGTATFLLHGTVVFAAVRLDSDGWRLYERGWPAFVPDPPRYLLDVEDEAEALQEALERTSKRIAEVEWLLHAAGCRTRDHSRSASRGATMTWPGGGGTSSRTSRARTPALTVWRAPGGGG